MSLDSTTKRHHFELPQLLNQAGRWISSGTRRLLTSFNLCVHTQIIRLTKEFKLFRLNIGHSRGYIGDNRGYQYIMVIRYIMISGPWLFGCVGFIGDEILRSYMGIIINHYVFLSWLRWWFQIYFMFTPT